MSLECRPLLTSRFSSLCAASRLPQRVLVHSPLALRSTAMRIYRRRGPPGRRFAVTGRIGDGIHPHARGLRQLSAAGLRGQYGRCAGKPRHTVEARLPGYTLVAVLSSVVCYIRHLLPARPTTTRFLWLSSCSIGPAALSAQWLVGSSFLARSSTSYRRRALRSAPSRQSTNASRSACTTVRFHRTRRRRPCLHPPGAADADLENASIFSEVVTPARSMAKIQLPHLRRRRSPEAIAASHAPISGRRFLASSRRCLSAHLIRVSASPGWALPDQQICTQSCSSAGCAGGAPRRGQRRGMREERGFERATGRPGAAGGHSPPTLFACCIASSSLAVACPSDPSDPRTARHFRRESHFSGH